MIRASLYAVCLMITLLIAPQRSNAQWISYETKVIAEELNVPWEIRWGYDNWIWFTERSGRFSKANPETGEKKVLLQIPFADHSDAEKGTLGFDFHPSFPDSPFVYIAYNHKNDTLAAFNVVRWTVDGDTLILPKTILDGLPTGQIHNGSRVRVGPDRKLYISTGEADFRELAQDVSSLSGKVLRLELDGSIPQDNPFDGSAIWSLGHRNPQGLEFGPTGILYSTEHGPASDDEFNLIERGGNYGWPAVEGYCDREIEQTPCELLNVKTPLLTWTPTVAVTGIQFCDQVTFPEWKNSILLATLKDQSLWVLKLAEDGKRVIATYRYPLLYTEDSSEVRRLRDYCFSPDGRLFVSTSNIWSAQWNPDKIVEIKRIDVIPFEIFKISPLAGMSTVSDEVKLVWQQSAGDSKYQVQVGSSSSMDSIVSDEIVKDTLLTVTLIPREDRYYWRVRELTSSGPWSAIDSFLVPSNSDVAIRESTKSAVYPNPANSQHQLRIAIDEVVLNGSIVDLLGKKVRSISAEELESKMISLSGLLNGNYFIVLQVSQGRTQLMPFNVSK
jgi:aldose sugar dehydrogenase